MTASPHGSRTPRSRAASHDRDRHRLPRCHPRRVHGRARASRSWARRRRRRRSTALSRRRGCRSTSPASTELLRTQPRHRPAAASRRRYDEIAAVRRRPLHLRRHAAERRARTPPTSATSTPRRARSRRCSPAPPGRRQVDGAGRHGRAARRAPRRAGPGRRRRRAGLEPRVPARGLRGRGHAAPGPARVRRRSATGPTPRAPARGLRAPILEAGTPVRRHRLRDRRAGEGRRQRVPRHEDLVHQRDGRGVRGDRRRRDQARRGARRTTTRIGRRSSTPASASAAAACPRTSAPSWPAPASSASTRRCRSCARSTRSTCGAAARDGRPGAARPLGGDVPRHARRASSARRSSRTRDDIRDSPALDVARPDPAPGRGRSRVYDPKAMDNARQLLPRAGLRATARSTPRRARTSCCS